MYQNWSEVSVILDQSELIPYCYSSSDIDVVLVLVVGAFLFKKS